MSDPRFTQGVELFNREWFFECHDILEELWMETTGRDKLFLQGVIQVAVGYYHFFNANYKGAASQLSKGLTKLNPYRPEHFGVDVDRFVVQVGEWLSAAERGRSGETVSVGEIRIPKLERIT